jgi:uncharacterized membrane protein
MCDELRNRVEELFQNAPKTRRAQELKEELLANLIDRYNDLINNGKSHEEAINSTISGIGDVDELIKGLQEQDVFNYERIQNQRKKTAAVRTSAIGLYIMSVVLLIFLTSVVNVDGTIAVCIMLTMDAIATCLIIYNSISHPKYYKLDDSIVEEFKEWKSVNSKRNEILKSVRSIVWTVIVAIYLLISFVFNLWDISWIIFIIGGAIERIIVLFFQLKE